MASSHPSAPPRSSANDSIEDEKNKSSQHGLHEAHGIPFTIETEGTPEETAEYRARYPQQNRDD